MQQRTMWTTIAKREFMHKFMFRYCRSHCSLLHKFISGYPKDACSGFILRVSLLYPVYYQWSTRVQITSGNLSSRYRSYCMHCTILTCTALSLRALHYPYMHCTILTCTALSLRALHYPYPCCRRSLNNNHHHHDKHGSTCRNSWVSY